jgi:23S rRNA (guanosine2251-2'-O)-methyltransferase
MADFLYGINPVREALQGEGRQPLELLVVKNDHNPRLQDLVELAKRLNLKTTFLPKPDLERMVNHPHHQGVLLKLTPFKYADYSDLLANWQASGQPAFFLLLDGITDPQNFGAILRSAEVAGCHGVIVAKDRSCPVTPVVEKTAAGALSHIPLCQVTNLSRTIEDLKKEAIWCYGLAGEAEAEDIFTAGLLGNLALVIGSEGKGLRPNVRNHCDGLLAIPMKGKVESLNASVAAGIALFEIVRQGAQAGSDKL